MAGLGKRMERADVGSGRSPSGRDGGELQRLVARVAEGDRDAFHPLFEALWPVVRRFAERSLGGADAEDAAQNALVKIFARASELDPARPALPWVIAIAASECRTLRRRAGRR